MLAKIGRPKSDNPKNIKFSFRMSEYENELLETICNKTGKNRNEALRDAIVKYYEFLKK